MLLCDVDGVLTDGKVLIGKGFEGKSFNIQDGLGIAVLRKAGILVGWISNRPSAATTRRAEELRIDFLSQEKQGKVVLAERFLAQAKLEWSQVCYMGDDLVDLGPMRRAGVGVAVANSVAEVIAAAHYVTRTNGGDGAVREVCELVLKAQDQWNGILNSYTA